LCGYNKLWESYGFEEIMGSYEYIKWRTSLKAPKEMSRITIWAVTSRFLMSLWLQRDHNWGCIWSWFSTISIMINWPSICERHIKTLDRSEK
jgi:hypothetical protein